jgi:hypothetical protein
VRADGQVSGRVDPDRAQQQVPLVEERVPGAEEGQVKGGRGAVLDLTYSDLRYLGPRVWAQPVIVLRNVSILRFCSPSNESDQKESQE